MKLEDISKDELIYLIRQRCICNLDDIEFDVLMYRAEKCREEAKKNGERANGLLGNYIDLLKPYAGKQLFTIPDTTIKRANEAMGQREECLKKERRKEAEYNKLHKRIDEILKC